MQMREWLDYNNIKVITIAAKADYLSKNQYIKSAQAVSQVFQTEVTAFSAKTGLGKDKVLSLLDEIIY